MYEFIYQERLNIYPCAIVAQTHTYRLCTEHFKHFSIHEINIHDITLLICIKSIIFFIKRIRNFSSLSLFCTQTCTLISNSLLISMPIPVIVPKKSFISLMALIIPFSFSEEYISNLMN